MKININKVWRGEFDQKTFITRPDGTPFLIWEVTPLDRNFEQRQPPVTPDGYGVAVPLRLKLYPHKNEAPTEKLLAEAFTALEAYLVLMPIVGSAARQTIADSGRGSEYDIAAVTRYEWRLIMSLRAETNLPSGYESLVAEIKEIADLLMA